MKNSIKEKKRRKELGLRLNFRRPSREDKDNGDASKIVRLSGEFIELKSKILREYGCHCWLAQQCWKIHCWASQQWHPTRVTIQAAIRGNDVQQPTNRRLKIVTRVEWHTNRLFCRIEFLDSLSKIVANRQLVSELRLNVLGASGSDASTVGRALAQSLSLPYFDSDDYFHAPSDPPFQKPRAAEERHAMITGDLSPGDGWVLGGGVAGWVPYPELEFSCIIFLYVPVETRLERLRNREFDRFGTRILIGGDMYEGHELQRHEAYLAEQTCPVLKFNGVLPLSTITERVLDFLRTS